MQIGLWLMWSLVLLARAQPAQRPFVVRWEARAASRDAPQPSRAVEKRGIFITEPTNGQIVNTTGDVYLRFDLIGFSVPDDGFLSLSAGGQVLSKFEGQRISPKSDFGMTVQGLGQGVQHIDFEAFDHNGNKIDELSDSRMVIVPPAPLENFPDFKFPVKLLDWRKADREQTKFLVFRINKGGQGGGFGDRMVGLTHTAALAALIGRGFLIDWTHPVALDTLLVPPSDDVEWRFDVAMKQYGYEKEYNQSHKEIDWVQVMNTDIDNLPRMDFHKENPQKFVVIRANFCFMFYTTPNPLYGPTVGPMDRFFGPVYRELFKPVAAVQAIIDSYIPKIRSKFTIGFHARTRVHECQEPYFNYEAKCGPWDYIYDKSMTKERYLAKYWDAADSTVRQMRIDDSKLQFYAMADAKVFFDEVRKRYGDRLLTVTGEPFHIDYDTKRQASFIHNQSVAAGFTKVLVDLYLLGECDEIIVPLTSNLGRIGAMIKNRLPLCTYPSGAFTRMPPHFCECKHDQQHWAPEAKLWAETHWWSKRVPQFSTVRPRT